MKLPVFPLYAPADAEAVRPVLDTLKKRGVTVRETDKPKSGDAVLLFLSKNLTEDGPAAAQFFASRAKTVIPVNLDDCTPPALIRNALMARHSIAASRYSVDELCERIEEALQKKNPLPWILGAAAAAVAVVIAVVLIVNAQKAKQATVPDEAEVTASPVPTEAPRVPADTGLTPEDLQNVRQLFIFGDRFVPVLMDSYSERFGYRKQNAEDYANSFRDETGSHWLDNETGEEITLHRWEDLDFLRYMTNLQNLDLICVEGTLPDLSGLDRLTHVHISDCELTGLDGLSGSRIYAFQYEDEPMDFSPLNRCERLKEAHIELHGDAPADLSAFAPKMLDLLELTADGAAVDASGLLNCDGLQYVTFRGVGISDLSCLANAKELTRLELYDSDALRSLNGLEDHASLEYLTVDNCFNLSDLNALNRCEGLLSFTAQDLPVSDLSFLTGTKKLAGVELRWFNSIRSLHGLEDHTALTSFLSEGLHSLSDISALASCTALYRVEIMDSNSLRDVSPVVGLPKLTQLELYGSGPDDVDYLADIVNKNGFSFGVAEVNDWSGLAAIQNYGYLNITDHSGRAMPYLSDAKIDKFELWYRSNLNRGSAVPIDYSVFPTVEKELILHGVPSLEGLPAYDVTSVHIDQSDFLTSLNGIENLKRIRSGNAVSLEIDDCPRLSDWSALEGLSLSRLDLYGLFTLPTFKDLSVPDISLEAIVGLTDLSPLQNLDPSKRYYIRLFDIDGVTDLSPLYSLKGERLTVPAHLGQQAALLQESGNFRDIDIRYPDGWWQPYEPHVKLYSLDELDTLPSALLAYVTNLNLLGDRVFNWDEYEWHSDWSTNPPTYYLIDRETGSEEVVPVGTMTDLSKLSVLTGLKNLNIANQALTTLEGIQYLGALEELNAEDCRDLTDVSAAFTMQNLRRLKLTNAPYTSIEGVQNLTNLEELEIWGTEVTSIEGVQALSKLRYFDLQWTPVTDLSPLGGLSDDCEIRFTTDGVKVQDFLALPDSVLSKVQTLCIAGDWLYNDNGQWWDEDWGSNGAQGWLSREDGSRTPIARGSIADLSFLNRLPNLKHFKFSCNPIETLDGIESLAQLEDVQIQTCPKITDVSVLFDMPTLSCIDVRGLPITSIAGVEKLPRLCLLSLWNTEVADLSPLAALDTTAAVQENRGFELSIDGLADYLSPEQYQALSHFPEFWNLDVYNNDCTLWMDAVKNAAIHEARAGGCHFTNETFRQFVEQHPELEYIKVPWTPELTDISPLLKLRNLNRVCISTDMPQAKASLGDNYPFELEIEG